MATWQKYKETQQVTDLIFESAKLGDLNTFLTNKIDLTDINRKNGQGYSALMLACYNGHYDMSDFLIQNGADVNSIDFAGNTILMGVAFKGHLEIAKLLVRNHANIDQLNYKNQSALSFAKMFGQHEIVNYLQSLNNQNQSYTILDQIKSWFSYLKA